MTAPSNTDLPTLYQQYIHLSRYSRFRNEDSRRETWDETVERYFDFFTDHMLENHNYKWTTTEMELLKSSVKNLEVMPSMRCLMTAGEALRRENIAGYNCFSRDTEFVTDQGIKSFSDFEDGDEINVFARNSFRPATIKKFGIEKLYEVIFTKGGKTKYTYLTTKNHRWIITGNSKNSDKKDIKTTDTLIPKDIIKYTPTNTRGNNYWICKVAQQHGMVFGDGTYDKNKHYCKIELCGDSTQFKDIFTTGRVLDSDKTIITQLPWNWKELPDINANKSYLLGFLMGWFGADGTIGKGGSNVVICNHKKENLDWFRSAAAKVGIFCSAIKENRRENPFKNGDIKPIYLLTIYGDTLPKEFFLKDMHAERYNSIKQLGKNKWTVLSVTETELTEDVWCVQEPEHEIFTLANGIQTMNCAYSAITTPRAFDEILYILMNGCFDKDTLIKTKSGDKKISDITTDDSVLSFNIEKNEYQYINPRNVVPTAISAEMDKLNIEFKDGSFVKCTEDHKFYTINSGWVQAKDLTSDDDIKNYHNNKHQGTVKGKTKITNNEEYWDMTIPVNNNYVLSNGNVVHNTGVGFSVERQEVTNLPIVADAFYTTETTIIVSDSKVGWAKAFKELIHLLYGGNIPKWDLSRVRPAGSPLKTFGGRSSGPEPLDELFHFVTGVFKGSAGRKLTSLECHDICCKIAEVVVVGGVRRCLNKDYEIKTNLGWVKITDINPNIHKIIIDSVNHPIKALINNGKQQLMNINMEDGTIHKSTAEHRWYVYNHTTDNAEWIETTELNSGNYSMLIPK